MSNPLDITTHAKSRLIEQIMALEGGRAPNPRKFREHLETESVKVLSETLEKILEPYEKGIELY